LPDGSALYGIAGGGALPSFGTAFKFDKAGNATVVYSFTAEQMEQTHAQD
jgi:uncharacterized repeat protein (TIGR03803 family)